MIRPSADCRIIRDGYGNNTDSGGACDGHHSHVCRTSGQEVVGRTEEVKEAGQETNFQVYFEPSEYYPIEMYQELLNTIVPVDVCFNDFAFRTSV